MASVMLRMAGPLSTVWQTALTHALQRSDARPLQPDQVEDILFGPVHPADRAHWLRDNDEFALALALAHRFAVNAHLAAENWKAIVMTLLDQMDNKIPH